MSARNSKRNTKCSKHPSFPMLMPWSMNPWEQANYKAKYSYHQYSYEINQGNFKLAVHSIIKRRKSTSWYKNANPCIVKTICDQIGSLIAMKILWDMGWKRWKIVLQSRQKAAVHRNRTMGHLDISWGLGKCWLRSIIIKWSESI